MISIRRILFSCAILGILMFSSFQHADAQTFNQRAVTVPIKVVLVGLDQVDTSYTVWSSGSSGNVPAQITNQVLLTGNSTGEIFHPQYDVLKAPASFKQEMESYLGSIEKDLNAPNTWFGYYGKDPNPDYCAWKNVTMNYAVYDANSVESWLWNNNQELGGFPSNGWTIIVSYLPELPSIAWKDLQTFERTKYGEIKLPTSKPHYYGISAVDSDLGYQIRYRDFMNAWGGKHGRMWFVDLSAGPVYNSQWDDLPLQVALGNNKIDLSTGFGQKWLTEYVADYVWQATYNFITPDFVYYPYYRPNYQIDAFIFDDRNAAEKIAVPIEKTVNKEPIQNAFRELVPYSNVTVNLSFVDVSPELQQTISSAYKYSDSWLSGVEFCLPERYGVVDVRPVYKYILDHMQSYERNPYLTRDTMTIPAFAFAFSNETYFTYTYKWSIGKTDPENGALLGIALDRGAFVSLNQYEFTRGVQVSPSQPGKGLGFTETIIHEVGHEFGLMHPHEFGNIGDFVYSAMGYFTNDYVFGQIDKDSLQRAHVDQVYFATQRMMNQLTADAASQVQARLTNVDALYGAMNYVDAMRAVLSAYQLAQQLASSVTPTQSQSTASTSSGIGGLPGFPIESILAGVMAGVAVLAVLRHRARRRRP